VSELVVFSSNGCAGCKAVVQELERRSIRHKVVKIDEDAEAMRVFKTLGHRTVPQVYTPDMGLLASSLMELLRVPQGVLEPFKNK